MDEEPRRLVEPHRGVRQRNLDEVVHQVLRQNQAVRPERLSHRVQRSRPVWCG